MDQQQGQASADNEQVPPLNIMPGEKALITVDNWFYAPDGCQYRAVFGTVRAVRTAEASLGVRPNGKSTNWYLEIGNVTLAGCQVHYALRTDTCHLGPATDWASSAEHGLVTYQRPSVVYDADRFYADAATTTHSGGAS